MRLLHGAKDALAGFGMYQLRVVDSARDRRNRNVAKTGNLSNVDADQSSRIDVYFF